MNPTPFQWQITNKSDTVWMTLWVPMERQKIWHMMAQLYKWDNIRTSKSQYGNTKSRRTYQPPKAEWKPGGRFHQIDQKAMVQDSNKATCPRSPVGLWYHLCLWKCKPHCQQFKILKRKVTTRDCDRQDAQCIRIIGFRILRLDHIQDKRRARTAWNWKMDWCIAPRG